MILWFVRLLFGEDKNEMLSSKYLPDYNGLLTPFQRHLYGVIQVNTDYRNR